MRLVATNGRKQGPFAMLDALLGAIFEVVLSAVGTVVVKLFGVDDAAEIATAIIGLGFLAIGVAITVRGQ